MKLFFVLALWGFAAAAQSDGPIYYSKGEGGRYRTDDWGRGDGPTTEPRPIRDAFRVDAWHINYPLKEHDEPVNGRDHYWDNELGDAMIEHVIPEVCHINADNCTVYNSFLLDCNMVKEFESVSPECRNFKCEAALYFYEHGADIYANILRAGSIKEAIQILHSELGSLFENLKVCTCGKEFFQAFFKVAPFYNGNALYAYKYDEYYMIKVQRFLRSLDFKALSKIVERIIHGICTDTRAGRCLNSIFTGFEEIAAMVENTIADYEDYDDGDKKHQKKEEKRCDAFFGPMKNWEDFDLYIGDDMGDYNYEEDWEQFFEQTSVFTNSLYCEKNCKKERKSGSIYPCCMRQMLEDKKLINALEKFVVSVYRTIPAPRIQYDNFAEFDHWFTQDYDLDAIMAWTIPEKIREAFMKTIHAAKYCPGRTMKCSDKPRPEA